MARVTKTTPPVAIDLARDVDGTPRASAPRLGPVLLIGTGATCRTLRAQLDLLDHPPETVGTAIVEPATDVADIIARARGARTPRVALVSLPSGERALSRRISATLGRLGIEERRVPPLDELLAGRVAPARTGARTGTGAYTGSISRSPAAQAFDPVALLGRDPRRIDMALAREAIRGRRVLITGAGGSIGAELAATVAALEPARLILIERSENALFEIDRRIGAARNEIDRVTLLHDIVDASGTRSVFETHAPEVVFHAAAHKHVPLMENHPAHAVVNNVLGTRSVAEAALAAGTDRFVLISSDKAVNPSSVMGATKRLAEMLIHAMQSRSTDSGARTRLAMVRFGNVLGSSGSVLPVWAAQLAEGGPITVTDERMTRYFMTIPEAAALVVQAAGLSASSGPAADTFVLDMGEPVRILDLAARFVAASGAEPVIGRAAPPNTDEIEIRITGARPGEKLYEELAYDAEQLAPTRASGVRTLRRPEWVDSGRVLARIDRLASWCRGAPGDEVVAALARLVPEFDRQRTRRAA